MTRKINRNMIQNLSSEKPETKNQTTPNHNRTPPLRADTRRPQESKQKTTRPGRAVGASVGGRPQQAQSSGRGLSRRSSPAGTEFRRRSRGDLRQRRGGRQKRRDRGSLRREPAGMSGGRPSRVEDPPETLWNFGGVSRTLSGVSRGVSQTLSGQTLSGVSRGVARAPR
ncbi:hypothetical protein ATANTOWER_027704 [Ataeniobius toweri]|uniref:Uncharacterized protein n=1 Tax=Ataeniobius toweri TaxID=208326 RepID=A0ABU7CBZ0_9TELE|nr:hypothetical protein [Ataeniobius toweri]